MKVKMEVFSGDPPCLSCIALLNLADEYQNKYEDAIEVTKLVGKEATEKFNQYRLSCTPATVINGSIRIEGICPSYETLDNALKEAGLWTK
jgi:hypothetical protein